MWPVGFCDFERRRSAGSPTRRLLQFGSHSPSSSDGRTVRTVDGDGENRWVPMNSKAGGKKGYELGAFEGGWRRCADVVPRIDLAEPAVWLPGCG